MADYLAIGLVVKGGEQFIEKWIECANRIGDIFLVIDNSADEKVKNLLINHPKTRQYLIQNKGRNQSRDYQKILDMAREEDIKWIWNLDIDELVPVFSREDFYGYLLNTNDDSIGFPLFEMREDDKHYVMIKDCTDDLKYARYCHKCYKVQSHFQFNIKDWHGVSIPHNCKPGQLLFISIQHFGHYNKEMRDEKRKQYENSSYKDRHELEQTWMEEDVSKIEIKEWRDWNK